MLIITSCNLNYPSQWKWNLLVFFFRFRKLSQVEFVWSIGPNLTQNLSASPQTYYCDREVEGVRCTYSNARRREVARHQSKGKCPKYVVGM